MKKLIAICLVVLVIAAGVHAGAVSTSTSKAGIDWASLTITRDITWGDKGSESYAYVEDATGSDEDPQSESEWTDTSASASIGDSYGDAYTSDDYLYEEVYAIAETTTLWAYAEAYAYRDGHFTATSDGWVEISADYELWQELLTDCEGEFPWTSGYAGAELWLTNDSTSEGDEDIAELEITVCGMDTLDGTLMVEMYFAEGDAGYFGVGVYNEASVQIPEPATIAILGLGALSLIRRKK
ncbi:MAG: PEP-CTERM sorting domain-containing protein [Phycisphaerae bacterium]|nr:PEP-CTERM sorting domain-containing protein [Phycisphaerae bacterium]